MIHSGLVNQKRARFEKGYSSNHDPLARYEHEIRPYVQTAVLPLNTKKYNFDARYNRPTSTETSYGDIFGKRTTPDERLYFYDRFLKTMKPTQVSTGMQTNGSMPPPAPPGVPPGNLPRPPPAGGDSDGPPPLTDVTSNSGTEYDGIQNYFNQLRDDIDNQPPDFNLELEAANVVLNEPGTINGVGKIDSYTENIINRIDALRPGTIGDSKARFNNMDVGSEYHSAKSSAGSEYHSAKSESSGLYPKLDMSGYTNLYPSLEISTNDKKIQGKMVQHTYKKAQFSNPEKLQGYTGQEFYKKALYDEKGSKLIMKEITEAYKKLAATQDEHKLKNAFNYEEIKLVGSLVDEYEKIPLRERYNFLMGLTTRDLNAIADFLVGRKPDDIFSYNEDTGLTELLAEEVQARTLIPPATSSYIRELEVVNHIASSHVRSDGSIGSRKSSISSNTSLGSMASYKSMDVDPVTPRLTINTNVPRVKGPSISKSKAFQPMDQRIPIVRNQRRRR